jgi:Xaa-Pro aminopeptidase
LSNTASSGLFALSTSNVKASPPIVKVTPVALAKVVKNATEISGFVQCHIRDGAALCAFFAWLEKELEAGNLVTELSAAEKLLHFRSLMTHFVGSYGTISASGQSVFVILLKN